jgi:glucose-6-phosphate-specific signal transduction histidine kinase
MTDYSYLKNKTLEVSPYDQYFQVNWTMPNYFNNQKNTYSTKLEGYEDQWFYQGNAPSIRYNQLPAGEYVLKVKGRDSRGNEAASILSIPISVKQIYYKTWWFISLLVLALIAIMYAIFKYRLQQALAIERLRTKISSDLHDDVGSMLTGLAMKTEILEMQSNNEIDKIKLRKITNQSRKTVSYMRDFVWSIDSRKDKLEDLIERLQELAEELLLPIGIEYKIDTNQLDLQKKLNPNCKRNLFLIYKEALNNIVKHSKAEEVSIVFNIEKGVLNFNIKDNGKISTLNSTTGQGLANMKMRAEHINAKLDFDLKNGFGINLALPLI